MLAGFAPSIVPFSFFLLPFSLVLLAIDPGREKCGLAVGEGQTILARAIVPAGRLVETVRDWSGRYAVGQIIMGDRTGADMALEKLTAAVPSIPVSLMSEEGTTLRARRRYFADHPPRGWRRLLPLSMQVPPEPYDDYAAVVILERHLRGGAAGSGTSKEPLGRRRNRSGGGV